MTKNKQKEEYLLLLLEEPFKVMTFIRESEAIRRDICPSIGKEIGRFLYLMVLSLQGKVILEVGTSIGYSTTWLALGARATGGHVDTVEITERLLIEAVENLKGMGLQNLVSFHFGPGEEVLPLLKKEYDLIFLDGATKSYPELFEKSLGLLKKGGLIIIEDALFAITGTRAIQKTVMDEFNRKVMKDTRVEATLLNLGDGLLLCYKK